jgi:hypothetical protein
LQFAQQRQNRYAVAELRLGLARTLLQLGGFDRANAILQDAQVAFELFGSATMLARTYCAWAGYHLGCGAQPAAEASLAKAEKKARDLHQPGILLLSELQAMRRQLSEPL